MPKFAQFAFRSGCLISLLAPVVAVALYPRAKWLFGFVVVGIVLLVLMKVLAKDPSPQALADTMDRLLSGCTGAWDVDDYEHLNPRNPQIRELWRRSMEVGGLPEQWSGLDEKSKDVLRDIIRNLRQLHISRL
jgi:hypothetical protein